MLERTRFFEPDEVYDAEVLGPGVCYYKTSLTEGARAGQLLEITPGFVCQKAGCALFPSAWAEGGYCGLPTLLPAVSGLGCSANMLRGPHDCTFRAWATPKAGGQWAAHTCAARKLFG